MQLFEVSMQSHKFDGNEGDGGLDQAVLSIQKEAANVETFIANQELESTKSELQRIASNLQRKDRQLTAFKRLLRLKDKEICSLKLEIDLTRAEMKMSTIAQHHHFAVEEAKKNMIERHVSFFEALSVNRTSCKFTSFSSDGEQPQPCTPLERDNNKNEQRWRTLAERRKNSMSRYISSDNIELEMVDSRSDGSVDVHYNNNRSENSHTEFKPSSQSDLRGTILCNLGHKSSSRGCSNIGCFGFLPPSKPTTSVTRKTTRTHLKKKMAPVQRTFWVKRVFNTNKGGAQYQAIQDSLNHAFG